MPKKIDFETEFNRNVAIAFVRAFEIELRVAAYKRKQAATSTLFARNKYMPHAGAKQLHKQLHKQLDKAASRARNQNSHV